MKKNSSMQGTLNKLFGKKNSTSSLYADNPPWMKKPQGNKKASIDYHDEIHSTFAFLDDSGTATLKARPGPRVRPVLQLSTSNIEAQGLAVPTPSVPMGYSDNPSIGNGSKLNGNYRMYSSVGDLRLNNYYNDFDEEIPAPPSVPPPPPPLMLPPAPPTENPPVSTLSSPASPSPPDFIPPTPNSSAVVAPNFVPSTNFSNGPEVSDWKSQNILNPVTKDKPVALPNRVNIAGFQHSHASAPHDTSPHSTIPKSFKIPPPAPTRSSSIQPQEYQIISYSKEPPPSPVPSSFKPSVQAKLFLAPEEGQKSLNHTLNKRKSMLIMEDLQELSQNVDNASTGNPAESLPFTLSNNIKTTSVLDNNSKSGDGILSTQEKEPEISTGLQKQLTTINTVESTLPTSHSEKNKEGSKRSVSSIEFNKMTFSKDSYIPNENKSTEPGIKGISVKPILTDLSPVSNGQLKHHSLTKKDVNTIPKEMSKLEDDIKVYRERSDKDSFQEPPPSPPSMAPPTPPSMAPPTPPSMAPPTPPMMILPKPPVVPPPPPPLTPPVTVTPPKTSPMMSRISQPALPHVSSRPPVLQASPLLSPKPKNSPTSSPPSIPVPPPPKAPPAPPPTPPPLTTRHGPTPEEPLPLLKALKEKQQTLKQVSKNSIEVRPAQVSSISSGDDQKARVGKIKGELEAIFSPNKGKISGEPKNGHLGLDTNKTSPSAKTTPALSGENTLVNSLMLKVPLLPADYPKVDVDEDNSDWLPKSKKTDIQIPEPDYVPTSPTQKSNRPMYSSISSETAMNMVETSPKSTSPPKDEVNSIKTDIPAYKPHCETKTSAGTYTLETLPSAVKEATADINLKPDIFSKDEKILPSSDYIKPESPVTERERANKHPVTGDQVEANSPLALLMAAKKRAQKGSRAVPLDRSNLPKISVSRGPVTSSFSSQYNEGKGNTFVVGPRKENGRMFGQEEVTSFSSKPNSHLDQVSMKSRWTDEALQPSSVSSLGFNYSKSDDEKVNVMHSQATTTEGAYEDLKSPAINHVSAFNPNLMNAVTFNISSVPSPIPASKTESLLDYEIIPPPAEFMNSPLSSDINMQQRERPYINDNELKSNLIQNYHWNNESNQSLVSQTTLSSSTDFDQYSGNYSTGLTRDPQKSSLIKKRLYMPDPESLDYAKNTNSLRSSTLSYGYMHNQAKASTMADRRPNNHARYVPQGRRVSSENVNKISTLPTGNPQTRTQNAHRPGMTFTVRPGSKHPISQPYQGGYL
ncbi:uncharacterized protein C6orf132 homolog [Gastrophryne carolinensis]